MLRAACAPLPESAELVAYYGRADQHGRYALGTKARRRCPPGRHFAMHAQAQALDVTCAADGAWGACRRPSSVIQ